MITNYIEKLDHGTIISSSNLRDWINSISKHGSSSMEVSKHLQISKLMIKFGRRGEGLWKKIELTPLKGGLNENYKKEPLIRQTSIRKVNE